MAETQQQLQSFLLQLLPADHSAVGNISLLAQFQAATRGWANRLMAVKIVDDRGIESLKVMKLMALGGPT